MVKFLIKTDNSVGNSLIFKFLVDFWIFKMVFWVYYFLIIIECKQREYFKFKEIKIICIIIICSYFKNINLKGNNVLKNKLVIV